MKLFLLATANTILFSTFAVANPMWAERVTAQAVTGPHVLLQYEVAGTAVIPSGVTTYGTSHSAWTDAGTTSADTGSGLRLLQVLQMCDCHVPVGIILTYQVSARYGYAMPASVTVPATPPFSGPCTAECAAADIQDGGGAASVDAPPATGGSTALDGGHGELREVGQPAGGAISTGGVLSSGGAISIDGEISSGGTPSVDAPVSSGGAIAAGGTSLHPSSATGGETTSGGAMSAGGLTVSGGAMSTGGATLAGGAIATGGVTLTGGAIPTGGTTAVPTDSGSKGCSCSLASHGRPTPFMILAFLAGLAILRLRRRRS